MKYYVPKEKATRLFPNQHAFSMSTRDLLILTGYLVRHDYKVTVSRDGMDVEKEDKKLWSLKYCKTDGLFYVVTTEENKQSIVAEVILNTFLELNATDVVWFE